MLLVFLVVLIVAPLIELYVLLSVGSLIGPALTILLSIATALFGGYLVRQQGLEVLMRLNRQMNQGETPAFEMFEGALLLLCGLTLLLPGFVTDLAGFVLLIPAVRRAVIEHGVTRLIYMTSVNSATTPRIIDVEHHRESD